MDILNLKIDEKFDAIWACASLVHFDLQETIYALNQFHKALKQQGILYVSLKQKSYFILRGQEKITFVNLMGTLFNDFILIELRTSLSNYRNQKWESFIFKAI
jgi:predicted SAM-dependent methyltransferase